jgi:HD-like signal output (HDOD) protein
MSAENALLTILVEKIRNDMLVLPTLPEMAIKVRQTADDPDSNLLMMADVIAQDPALAARMIKVANSAFMGRAIKVNSLNQAITRIGLSQVKNIATAMAMEQLFVSQNEQIKERMSQVWHDSVNVTSISLACLRRYLNHNKQCNLNMDVMTLAGLMHLIGALPILTEAERYQTVFGDAEFLEGAIQSMSGQIGASIMRAWEFPDAYSQIVLNWNNASYQSQELCYIDFIRLGALAQSQLEGTARMQAMEPYIERGIVPDAHFMDNAEIRLISQEIKALLS